MAVYGRLKCKNDDSEDYFYPKTYANLVYMKGNINKTVQTKIDEIISGTQKVGSATKADSATTAASATTADKIDGYDIVVREKGYTPSQGNYKNTIVFIRQN